MMAVIFCIAVACAGISWATRAQASSDQASSGSRLITVYDKGRHKGILTSATTLREAFKEAGLAVDPSDLVEPALDSQLVANQYEVNIYRARPVTIVDGAIRQKVVSPYQTARQVAAHANITLNDEDTTVLSANTDMVSQGAGLNLTITRATPFTLVLYGKRVQAYTQAETVGDMLKQKDITIGASDTLSLAKTTPITAGMTVELWRDGKQIITEDEAVAFGVDQTKDADQPAGYKKITTPGVDGTRTVSYEIEMKNGIEVNRTEIQSVTTLEPVRQVEIIGVKFNYTGGTLNEEQITFLGTCESGMTASRNSGNGFYGAFQFMPATWRTVAPAPYNAGMPHEAPLDAQKQAVQTLLSRSSIFSQFPGCAKKMRAAGVI